MAEVIYAVGLATSIYTLGQAAWDLATTLHGAYKDFNRTVRDLGTELGNLRSACELVHDELKEIEGKAQDGGPGTTYDPDGRLYKCIEEQRLECGKTLELLQNLVDKLQSNGSNSVQKFMRPMKLFLDGKELKRIRACIRAHIASLNTVLLLVNIKISRLAPGFAVAALQSKIEELLQMKTNLQNLQMLNLQSLQVIVRYVEEQAMKATALCALNDSATVSDDNDSAIGDMNYTECTQNPDLSTQKCGPAYPASTSGSTVPEDEENGPDREINTLSEDEGPSTSCSQRQDSDPEDPFPIALFRSAMEAGDRSYADCVWLEAHDHFLNSLQLIQNVPAKYRQVEIFRLRFRLAFCAFHVQEPAIAAKALLAFIQVPATTDEQSMKKATASHLLSQTYIRLGKLELARMSCQSALAVRERLCSKNDPLYVESVELMAEVNRLVENNEVQRQTFNNAQPKPDHDVGRTLVGNASLQSHGPLPAYVTDGEECSDTMTLTSQIYIAIPGVVEASVAEDPNSQSPPELNAAMAEVESAGMQRFSDVALRETPMWRRRVASLQLCRDFLPQVRRGTLQRARTPRMLGGAIQNSLRTSLTRSRDNFIVFLEPAIQRIEPASDRFLEPVVGFFLDPWTGQRSRRRHQGIPSTSSVHVGDAVPVMMTMDESRSPFTPIEPVRPALWIVATFVDIMEQGSGTDRVTKLVSALIEGGANVVERIIAGDEQRIAAENTAATSDDPTAPVRREDDALMAVVRALLKEVPSLLRFVRSVIDAPPNRHDWPNDRHWERCESYGPSSHRNYTPGYVTEISEN